MLKVLGKLRTHSVNGEYSQFSWVFVLKCVNISAQVVSQLMYFAPF